LTSARGVVVFADYQLLAAMGSLLDYLKTAVPADAAPLDTIPLGVLPTRFPPILIWPSALTGLQQWESGPLKVIGWPNTTESGNQPPAASFDQRWPITWGPSTKEKESVQDAMTVQMPAQAVEVASASDPETPEPAAHAPSGPLELHAGVQN